MFNIKSDANLFLMVNFWSDEKLPFIETNIFFIFANFRENKKINTKKTKVKEKSLKFFINN
jgi:hypothetical protein